MTDDKDLCNISVRFLGVLRNLTGTTNLTLTLPEGTMIADLLTKLCEKLGDDFKNVIIDQTGAIDTSTAIFINGVNIMKENGAKTKLTGTATVEIASVPQLSGG